MIFTRTARTVAVVATTMALTPVAQAHADVQRFTDARNDSASSVDIRSVRVDNSSAARQKVIVSVRQDRVHLGDSIQIYLDTRRRDPGPEYAIGGAPSSEYFMYHQERWKGRGRLVPFRCRYSLKIHENTDRTRAVIPRACLDFPGKVRVAVQAQRGFRPVTSRDWAKAKRTWFQPVAR